MTKKISDVLKLKLDNAVKSLLTPKFMGELADNIKTDIIKRTKLGYGVEKSEGPQSKLKPLSPEYKKARKELQLGEFASPAKSNLTLTGDMLNDLKSKVTETKVTIFLGSQFSKDKAKWNAERGRTFMNISKTQIAKLTSLITLKLKELLK